MAGYEILLLIFPVFINGENFFNDRNDKNDILEQKVMTKMTILGLVIN